MRERFQCSSIQLRDHRNNSHEVILKNLEVLIVDEVHGTYQNPSIKVTLELSFTFELVNVTALAAPLEFSKGGEEYERIRKRTLVGK